MTIDVPDSPRGADFQSLPRDHTGWSKKGDGGILIVSTYDEYFFDCDHKGDTRVYAPHDQVILSTPL